MEYSETTQQLIDEALITAEALIADGSAEALIAEAKAITANFRLNRDGRELKERLLALGNALNAAQRAESETEKRSLALGFIFGVTRSTSSPLISE